MIVKVDHRTIAVAGVPEIKNASGLFIDVESRIEVLSILAPAQQAEILLHELIHAIWATRAFPKIMKEEEVCTQLAPALATVLGDNPHLMNSLGEALGGGIPIFEKE